MNNVETKGTRGRSTIRCLSILIAITTALVVGRTYPTESASADGAATEGRGVAASDAALGEALMQFEGQASSGESVAQGPGWYTCTVHRAGPGWGNVYLSMSSPSFSQRWFRAIATQQKEILAAGLTAVSADKKVLVYVTGTELSPYGEIRACYVLK